jgi:hypothetical protein
MILPDGFCSQLDHLGPVVPQIPPNAIDAGLLRNLKSPCPLPAAIIRVQVLWFFSFDSPNDLSFFIQDADNDFTYHKKKIRPLREFH